MKNVVVWVRASDGSRANLGIAAGRRDRQAEGVQPHDMMIGWTTTETRADAERLGRGLVEAGLAACVQISGPISSFYRWHNKLETAEEFRVAVKYAATQGEQLAEWIARHHSYETPQWVAVRADAASEKYLKWVVEDPT